MRFGLNRGIMRSLGIGPRTTATSCLQAALRRLQSSVEETLVTELLSWCYEVKEAASQSQSQQKGLAHNACLGLMEL